MSKRTQAKRDLRKANRKAAKKLKMLQKSQAEKRGVGASTISNISSHLSGSPSGGRDAQIRFAKTRRSKARNEQRKALRKEVKGVKEVDGEQVIVFQPWSGRKFNRWPLPSVETLKKQYGVV